LFENIYKTKEKKEFLWLSGPPGGGKSTLIKALASQLSIEVCSFTHAVQLSSKKINSSDREFAFRSSLACFAEFLKSHERFSSLVKDDENLLTLKILLFDDFPTLHFENCFERFRTSVFNFIKSSSHPLIFIISDGVFSQSDLYKMFPLTWRTTRMVVEI
jgi:DNA replication protein DnaC